MRDEVVDGETDDEMINQPSLSQISIFISLLPEMRYWQNKIDWKMMVDHFSSSHDFDYYFWWWKVEMRWIKKLKIWFFFLHNLFFLVSKSNERWEVERWDNEINLPSLLHYFDFLILSHNLPSHDQYLSHNLPSHSILRWSLPKPPMTYEMVDEMRW